MKITLKDTVIFDPSSGTVNFLNTPNFDQRKVVAIINLTYNKLIYAAGLSGYTGTMLDSTTMYLSTDLSGQQSSNVLQVIYDMGSSGDLASADSQYLPVRPLPQRRFRTSFAKSLTIPDPSNWNQNAGSIPASMSATQSNSNLVITSGNTANQELLIRSTESFTESFIMKCAVVASQRIANCSLIVELVDVIGDNLAFSMVNATSVGVTIPNNPYTTANIGQGMNLSKISGIATSIPGRFVINNVVGNVVYFTVSGWTASGSGTLSLFGHNYHQVIYSGVSATAFTYDAQRAGWNSGATSMTSQSTAGVGHIIIVQQEDNVVSVMDQLAASNTALPITNRGSRVQNIPDRQTPLFLQIRVVNGTTAPASSTTFTLGFASIENYAPQSVTINSVKPSGVGAGLPVFISNQVANQPVNLQASSQFAGDFGVGYRASAANAGTIRNLISAAGTNATSVKTSAGRLLGYQFSNTTTTFKWLKFYNLAAAPTVGSSAVVMTVGLPPSTYIDFNCEGGLAFATGIACAVTGASGDADTTSIAAGDVVGSIFYM